MSKIQNKLQPSHILLFWSFVLIFVVELYQLRYKYRVTQSLRRKAFVFFNVKTTEEVLDLVRGFEPAGREQMPLSEAFDRVLSEDISSPENLPGFLRTTVDGYAIQARDSFGATESLPAFLEIAGEVRMGETPYVSAGSGRAVRISTGGMLPQGADSVVMIEYCHLLDENTLEISRAVSPQENVIQPDDDFKEGALVLKAGRRLRPQDVGVLAGLGIMEVPVFRVPKVAVISTGDEVIPVEGKPKPGQVRDMNTTTLGAFCRQERAAPLLLGLCGDRFDELLALVREGLEEADAVWVSGGSSVGTRDLTLKVFESLEGMTLLVHGISVSPGKPTIIARAGRRALFGLPGHVASAMVVAEVFLRPFLAALSGETDSETKQRDVIKARLTRNLESVSGRDDFIRVRLVKENGEWLAVPIFGKSGLISTLVEADGLVHVDRNTEGLYRGDRVAVQMLR
jgi:molybdopterin molybdotransferase